jgi:hypothetical protein
MTDSRELTLDEIGAVSGGKIEFDFLGLATIQGGKDADGCLEWRITFRDGSLEGGLKCP